MNPINSPKANTNNITFARILSVGLVCMNPSKYPYNVPAYVAPYIPTIVAPNVATNAIILSYPIINTNEMMNGNRISNPSSNPVIDEMIAINTIIVIRTNFSFPLNFSANFSIAGL